MKKAAICIVQSRVAAESIVSELRRSGFASDDISVLFPDKKGSEAFAHEQHTKAPEGALAGVGAGGILGGTVGLLAGLGALAIPGAGPFIAAGPLLGALSGAASGATLGAIAGALVGMGIPEVDAKRYEGKIKGGHLLISVHTESVDEQRRAKQIFEVAQADDIAVTAESAVPHVRDALTAL